MRSKKQENKDLRGSHSHSKHANLPLNYKEILLYCRMYNHHKCFQLFFTNIHGYLFVMKNVNLGQLVSRGLKSQDITIKHHNFGTRNCSFLELSIAYRTTTGK